MEYTITGNAHSHDAGRFALGPHGISVKDGSNVLPDDVERTHWKHLSSRDLLIIALETMYLRGFVISILVNSLVKKKRASDAVLKTYKDFWASWSQEGGLNYKNYYEKALKVYGGQVFIADLENKLGVGQADRGEREVSNILEQIGREFANMCDPFGIILDPLRSELAKKGESTFIEASDDITAMLESILKIYRITGDRMGVRLNLLTFD